MASHSAAACRGLAGSVAGFKAHGGLASRAVAVKVPGRSPSLALRCSASEAQSAPQREFEVEMKCDGCVKNVRRNLEPLEGVEALDISLEDKRVRIKGPATLEALQAGLQKTGLKNRLIS